MVRVLLVDALVGASTLIQIDCDLRTNGLEFGDHRCVLVQFDPELVVEIYALSNTVCMLKVFLVEVHNIGNV